MSTSIPERVTFWPTRNGPLVKFKPMPLARHSIPGGNPKLCLLTVFEAADWHQNTRYKHQADFDSWLVAIFIVISP